MEQQMPAETLHSERISRLVETLRNIQYNSDDVCPWRVTGMNYDLVSCILEHSNEAPIIMGKQIQEMDQSWVERELRNVYSLPTSGTVQDINKQLTRAWKKVASIKTNQAILRHKSKQCRAN